MIHTLLINMDGGAVLRELFLEHIPREGELVQLGLSESTYVVAKIMNILVDSQQACGVYLKKVNDSGEVIKNGLLL